MAQDVETSRKNVGEIGRTALEAWVKARTLELALSGIEQPEGALSFEGAKKQAVEELQKRFPCDSCAKERGKGGERVAAGGSLRRDPYLAPIDGR